MNRRADMIEDFADDISCGEKIGGYDAAFFLDSLIDDQRVEAADVAVLLCLGHHTDAHIRVSDRLREMIKQDAIEFFTNGRGVELIDDKIAEEIADEEADAAYQRKYGRGEPDGDRHEEQLIKERAA